MAERLPNFEDMTNNQLMERYRFNRRGILFVKQLVHGRIEPPTRRSQSLNSLEKVLITLRYLATGGIQLNDADIHDVSQPTVSRAITEVIDALCQPDIIRRFIQFPLSENELARQADMFYGIHRFPKVVGVIDGTQIKIQAPHEHEEIYVNRKGFHSINAQLVFNASDNIVDVVARWPGSTHDSRILNGSGLRDLLEESPEGAPFRNGNYHLLGDSGYPCKRWLLTPYLEPQPGAQERYNRAHKITRAKVERGIGQLKRRFGILHNEVRMKPQKVCRVIIVCSILHNICKLHNIPLQVEENLDFDNENLDANNEHEELPNAGLRYRDYVANTYFG